MNDDLISRKAAIDAINRAVTKEVARWSVKELPSAQKHGKWVKNQGRFGWHCSNCMTDNMFAYSWNSEIGKNEFQDKYCPNCGAEMRGEEDE